jgi:hypothetical protein
MNSERISPIDPRGKLLNSYIDLRFVGGKLHCDGDVVWSSSTELTMPEYLPKNYFR